MGRPSRAALCGPGRRRVQARTQRMEWKCRGAGTCGRALAGGRRMTRIVSGTWGGRRLRVPDDARVRPTAERVREAWLNILGPVLDGANVLDLRSEERRVGKEC